MKDAKFAGAAVVRARGITSAMKEAHRRGCNPGGQVMAIPGGNDPPPFPVNKLLTKEELGPGKTVGELEDEGHKAGTAVKFWD